MDGEINGGNRGMRLRVAALQWAGIFFAFLVLVMLAAKFNSSGIGNFAFLFYFAAGFYLNRCVLRRLIEWHPMYNTIENVSSSKLKFFLLWPILYPSLFFRLGVNKVL